MQIIYVFSMINVFSKAIAGVALSAAALCTIFGLPAAANAEQPAKPNIVLILSDDQAWTDYGFMGHEQIETPSLDALARSGATFRRGYVPTALCRPSLATLLTGHYASTHHVTGNDPSPKYAPKDSDLFKQRCAELIAKTDTFELLPQVLGRQGYLSHQSGKLWEGSYQRCGFTHGMTRGFPKPGGRHGDAGLKIGREGLEPITDFLDIAQQKQQPFFLWYAPFLPHQPHNPPERLLKKYQAKVDSPHVAKYYAMCEWFDETCGELMNEIDDRGMTDNTLFVYVCDNGWIQEPNKPKYALRSKQSANEGGIRTPIMYSWKNKIAPQARAELATSLDIYPTILAAAGIEVPSDLPGLNLLPELREEKPIERNVLFGEGFAHDIADLDDPTKSLIYQWAIQGNWKLLLRRDGEVNRYKSSHPTTTPKIQLFDLSVDPEEQKNLADEMPDKVNELNALIDNWKPAAHPSKAAGNASTTFDKTGFIQVFDGKTLDGWSGDAKFWSVEDGALTGIADGSLKRNHFITWNGSAIRNFELRVNVKVSEGGNSGIQYRGKLRPDLGSDIVTGYQCDVVANNPNYNGMLYEEKGRRILSHTGEKVVVDSKGQPWVVDRVPVKTFEPDHWHEYRVLVEGNHHRHWIDGHLTADLVDLDEKGRSLEGVLAVQVHVGPAMKIQYRDFWLKHLPDDLPLQSAENHPIAPNAYGVRPQGKLPKDWKAPVYGQR